MAHSNSLIDMMRTTHEEERRLWNIEKESLLQKIVELQDTLAKTEAIAKNQNQILYRHSFSVLRDVTNVQRSGTGSAGQGTPAMAPLEESQKAVEAGKQAPGISSSSPPSTSNLQQIPRLPSISEDASSMNRTQTTHHARIDPIPPPSYKPTVFVQDAAKNLDGIHFKKDVLVSPESLTKSPPSAAMAQPPPIVEPVVATPLPHIDLSTTVPLSQARVPVLDHLNNDPYTAHGGHTPLPTDLKAHVAEDASPTTLTALRSQESAINSPGTDCVVRTPRKPSERRDSYFPEPDDEDEDVALTGPLGIVAGQLEANQDFLAQVGKKLAKEQITQERKEEVADEQRQERDVPAEQSAPIVPEVNSAVPIARDAHQQQQNEPGSNDTAGSGHYLPSSGIVSPPPTSASAAASSAPAAPNPSQASPQIAHAIELDDTLPIKVKRSTNFGRPLGEA